MTDDAVFRWRAAQNGTIPPGWAGVLSPLGASLLVPLNSPVWELCMDWMLLNSGRGALDPSDPVDYFGYDVLRVMPAGLVAELYGGTGRWDDFAALLVNDPAARAHILRVPKHVFQADEQDLDLISECVDVARLLQARAEAQDAAREAVNDGCSGAIAASFAPP